MSFDQLSNELIIKILSFIPQDDNGLLSFVKTSRHLHALSLPRLYSNVGQSSCLWSALFLRTVLERPDLAAFVEHFTGDGSNFHETPGEQGISFNEQSSESMKKAIEQASGTEEHAENWFEELSREENWDAATALILCILPNLHGIYMDSYQPAEYIAGSLARAAMLQREHDASTDRPSPYSMSKLNVVSLSYWDTEDGLDLEQAKAFLRIPSVKVFNGTQVGVPHRSTEEFTSNVEELVFHNSNWDSDTMTELLQGCPHIRVFFYDHGSSIVGYERFSATATREGLEASKETLEQLTLTISERQEYDDDDEPQAVSFAEFPKLRVMYVDASVLLGKENYTSAVSDEDPKTDTQGFLQRIPQSLESLRLAECSSTRTWDCVRELVKHKEEAAPNLRSIRLEYGYLAQRAPKDSGKDWVKICNEAGVELKLQPELLDNLDSQLRSDGMNE